MLIYRRQLRDDVIPRGAGAIAMTTYRVLVLAAVLAVSFAGPAAAQFGGMPGMGDPTGMPGMGMPGGMPGYPGMPGYGAAPAQPQGPPPACTKLMSLRDETQKTGLAVQGAGKRKATPAEACKLFNALLTAEGKFIRGLEDGKAQCGVPDEVIKKTKAELDQITQIRKQVCEMAAQGPQNAGPSLSDALNSTPTLPETPATGGKPKTSTFDTLQGNVLVR
jgi:hypothetical protein